MQLSPLLCFKIFIENRLFSQRIHLDHSLFLPLFLQLPLSQIHSPFISSSQKSRPSRDGSQTGQNKIHNIRQKLSYWEVQGNPIGGRVPRAPGVRYKLTFTLRSSSPNTEITAIIYTGPCRPHAWCFNFYEPMWALISLFVRSLHPVTYVFWFSFFVTKIYNFKNSVTML